MNNKELNETLRYSAIKCGLCNQWQQDWKEDWDEETMINKFYKGLDFFLKYRFISNEFIKKNFSIEYRRNNGVLVDDKYSLLNTSRALILGHSESNMRFNGRAISVVNVLDDSSVNITAKNRSYVMVHALGKAHVKAEAFDTASVVIIVHSEECTLDVEPNVVVKYELDYLTK